MEILQKTNRTTEITEQFFSLLDKHIEDILEGKTDFVYRVRDFAKLLHIHPTYLSNTVHLSTGKSPYYFVEKRLLTEAKKMLDDATILVKDICYKLTFHEPTNFTKFFKKMEGITPRRYRKKLNTVTNF